MAMEVILRVAGSAPADETPVLLGRVEEAGFAGAGIPDTQLIMRDAYVALALAAERTSHLTLYTAVTNPVTRHVSVLASLAQTLEELAPGRVSIVIGAGYSAVRTIGQRPASLRQMRESVLTLRRLLSGETVSLDGFEAHLPYASQRHIPILIAATGPRTIELAGEVADGGMLSVGIHPAMMDAARERLEAGARMAGKDPASLEVIYVSRVHVAPDVETARAMARPICAQWVLEPYRARWLREAGLEVPDLRLPPELASVYPDIGHAEDWEEARRLTSFLSDDMVAQICDVIGIFGTPEDFVPRLRELERWGVGSLFVQTMETYALPESTLRAFREEILPSLRSGSTAA